MGAETRCIPYSSSQSSALAGAGALLTPSPIAQGPALPARPHEHAEKKGHRTRSPGQPTSIPFKHLSLQHEVQALLSDFVMKPTPEWED